MRNLLSAGFYRLWRDRWFWAGVTCAAVLSAALSAIGAMRTTALIGPDQPLGIGSASPESFSIRLGVSAVFFQIAPFTGILIALYTALAAGTEHGDGALRNKLIVGHPRARVYLAQFTVVLAAAGCFTAAWMLGGLACVPILGWERVDAGMFAAAAGVLFLAAAALSAMLLLPAMMISRRAVSVVITALLAFGLICVGAILHGQLSESETLNGMTVIMDGNGEPSLQPAEERPNPAYVGGTPRAVMQFILDCLPVGQQIQMVSEEELARPLLSASASVFLTFTCALAGVFAFGKKDLS